MVDGTRHARRDPRRRGAAVRGGRLQGHVAAGHRPRGRLLQGDAALPLRQQGSDARRADGPPRSRCSAARRPAHRPDRRGRAGGRRIEGFVDLAVRFRREIALLCGDLPELLCQPAFAHIQQISNGSRRVGRALRRGRPRGSPRRCCSPASPRRAPSSSTSPTTNCARRCSPSPGGPSSPSTRHCHQPPTTKDKDSDGNPALPARPGLVRRRRGSSSRSGWSCSSALGRPRATLQRPDGERLHHARHRVAARASTLLQPSSSPRPAAPPAPSWSRRPQGRPAGHARRARPWCRSWSRRRRRCPAWSARVDPFQPARVSPDGRYALVQVQFADRRATRSPTSSAPRTSRSAPRPRRRAAGRARRRGDERRAGGRLAPRRIGVAGRRWSSWSSPSARWSRPA